MKKSVKPLIVIISSLLVIITIILLISQGIRLKYEELQRELTQLENKIKTEKNIMVNFIANYQMLTAEDVIKTYAINELALVETKIDSETKFTLLNEEIKKLNESLKSKYE